MTAYIDHKGPFNLLKLLVCVIRLCFTHHRVDERLHSTPELMTWMKLVQKKERWIVRNTSSIMKTPRKEEQTVIIEGSRLLY